MCPTCAHTDDAKTPVATWFEWQLQQRGSDEAEVLQHFLAVQVAFDGDNHEGNMSLAHLRQWLQVCTLLLHVNQVQSQSRAQPCTFTTVLTAEQALYMHVAGLCNIFGYVPFVCVSCKCCTDHCHQ